MLQPGNRLLQLDYCLLLEQRVLNPPLDRLIQSNNSALITFKLLNHVIVIPFHPTHQRLIVLEPFDHTLKLTDPILEPFALLNNLLPSVLTLLKLQFKR